MSALPRNPRDLAATLPDLPRWVETRSLLLSGRAVIRTGSSGDAAIAINCDARVPSGALVGGVDGLLLRDVLADVPGDFELLVQMEALDRVREALRSWRVAHVVVHSPAHPYVGAADPQSGVVVASPPEERWLAGLPEEIRVQAAAAQATAVKLVDGGVVAICAAGDVTETLWDVGIDTLEGHRRRGHASACFLALAGSMAAAGRQPVWSAYADYRPSLELAAKLGFRPVDRLAVLSPDAAALA